MNSRRKKAVIPVMAAVTAFCVSYTGTAAYLSRSPGEAVNVITAGTVKAELTEEHWDPEGKDPLHPLESTAKDPTVKNVGLNRAHVFLQVDIPVENISLIDEETKLKTEKADCEIFTFQADEEAWELVSREPSGGKMRYIYGYREVLLPGQETGPLFQEVQAVNYLEGDLQPDKDYEILVTALAIQDDTEGGNLQEIYQELLRETEADGKGETT